MAKAGGTVEANNDSRREGVRSQPRPRRGSCSDFPIAVARWTMRSAWELGGWHTPEEQVRIARHGAPERVTSRLPVHPRGNAGGH